MTQNAVSAAIVEPYAEALMSVAQSNNITNEVGEDVRGILEMLQSSDDLKEFLTNPLTKAEAKKGVLEQLLQSKIQPYLFNFLMLLVDRRRTFLLEAICRHYQSLLRKLNNTILAEVISAIELNESQRQQIIAKVQQMTEANQVELAASIDKDLIGGVIIKIGSEVLDASIRGQLRRMTTSLMSA
ncbi:ATP synthase subunit delta [Acaryochloris thomasi RCC1774]|uniref:ATP synthase subunit delta n=1 Tax=Acaryochloris thomasi RCC1774 TaxID=1764569 RepID=A0A2W1JN83_9CYAN|nr:ATP synthase F1 subunit delta [Acaryochloris thomasi]PZD74800.1 ATP synthase subunit delta [Acaryochloris thomasi RCC1774]